MSAYVFGDLHGCFDEFIKLLEKVNFNPKLDNLVLTGDLIGRGPKPLETLEYLLNLKKTNPNSLHAVLGNHDLNFLAVAYGVHKAKHRDRLEPLLQSNLLPQILEFYLSLPLLYVNHEQKFIVSHAGIYPKWGLNQAHEYSNLIFKLMQDPIDRMILLSNMYGDKPDACTEDLKKSDLPLWRFILSAFTRMRLTKDGINLDYGHSNCSVSQASEESLYPWFKFCPQFLYNSIPYRVIFGHWAALNGQCNVKNIIALDTGCVWGNELTCYCTQSGEKFSVKSKVHID